MELETTESVGYVYMNYSLRKYMQKIEETKIKIGMKNVIFITIKINRLTTEYVCERLG